MSKSSACNKGKALHISQWIKGELGGRYRRDGDADADDDCGDDEEEELELWSAERMHAKQAEIRRRLSSAVRDVGGGDVVIEMGTDTGSVVSSPGDSQVRRRVNLLAEGLTPCGPYDQSGFCFFFLSIRNEYSR